MNAEDIINNTDPRELRNLLRRMKVKNEAFQRPVPNITINAAPSQFPAPRSTDFRAVAADGIVRLVMSAISLDAEFNINANLAAFDETGTVTFYVDADDGKLYAAGGAVWLDEDGIHAASGTIGGWVLGEDALTDAAGSAGLLSTITGGDDIRFFAGDTDFANADFRVYESGLVVASNAQITGVINATSGEIGGWHIASATIIDAAGVVGLSSAVTGGNDIRIFAGSGNPTLASFRVYENGDMVASSATISGSITATSGAIGGWTISSSYLRKLSGLVGIVLDSTTPKIQIGDTGGTYIEIDGANKRVRSSNFSTGLSGFNISADTGDAEFNNIVARGELKTFLLTSSNQMAVAGNIIVSKDAGKLGADVSSGATTVNFGKSLTVGDWIKIQGPDSAGSNNLEWMLIGSLVSGTTYNVTRNVDGTGANGWLKDTPFVVIGHNGDSRIELVAGASASIQLVTQGATWNAQTIQAEMSTVAGAITAGGGNVVMNSTGITFSNDVQVLGFKNAAGVISMYLHAVSDDAIQLINNNIGKSVKLQIKTTDGSARYVKVFEDPDNADVARMDLTIGTAGSQISMGGEVVIWAAAAGKTTVFNESGTDIDFRIEGDTDPNLFKIDAGLDAVAIGGGVASGKKLKVTGDTALEGAVIINEGGADKDTIIRGDTDNSLLIVDAGLDAIGMGGAAESGYKLKVTGDMKVTGKIRGGEGTSFPGSPSTGDRFFRTDLGWSCFYDGTRWLTDFELSHFFPYASGFAVDGDSGNGSRIRGDYAIYVTRVSVSTYITGTNNGSNYWTVTLKTLHLGVGVAQFRAFNSSADTHDVFTDHDSAADTPNPAYSYGMAIYYAKVGSPGTFSYSANVCYRLIVT